MAESQAGNAIVSVKIAGSIALFADARAAPAGLDERALADLAGKAITAHLGRPVPVLYARQVHGALTYTYGHESALPVGAHLVGACDALITGEPDVALLIRTADCLPIVLAAKGVAAIVHAGWRGLAADVLGATVRRLGAEFGVPPRELEAACGVGIGRCHYEVGPEVIEALAARPTDAGDWRSAGGVDLGRWAMGRLRTLGLASDKLHALPGCTACDPRYHSFRRDGPRAGRQWSAVVRPDPVGRGAAAG